MRKIVLVFLSMILLSSCATPISKGSQTDVKLDDNSVDLGLWQAQKIDELSTQSVSSLSSGTFNISFWIKPTTNKTGTTLFVVGDSKNYVQCTTSNFTEVDGIATYSGISLYSKVRNNSFILASEGEYTLETGKFNQVVVNYEGGVASIYLNGVLAIEGNIKIETNTEFIFGKDLNTENLEQGYVAELLIKNYTLSEEKIVKEYQDNRGRVLLDSITFANMDDVQNAPWLVDIIIEETPVTWSSSNPDVMSIYGKMKPVNKDTEVIMTAEVNINGITTKKDFLFSIKAKTPETSLQRDLLECDASVQKIIHDGFKLPTTFTNQSEVTWHIIRGDAIVNETFIYKNTDVEKEEIEIEATLVNEGQQISKIYKLVLLDKIEGYILSYFNGELSEETGKLAYSSDALNWKDLNQGNSIITSELGNGRIRDPFITRDKNGNFAILATEGFDNPFIYIIKSKDLIDLTNQQLVQVAYYDKAIQMSGTRAWAPEMTYDMETDQYYIYFSDPGVKDLIGHIYAVTTNDFEDFSYPYSFYEPGYNVIDGTIVPIDGKYWMLYKDERKAAQTIFYASTDRLRNGFGLAFDDKFIFEQKNIEGPFVTKVEESYYLYVDHYPKANFHVAKFTHLGDETDFEWLDESKYHLPNEDVRHGSIVAVTKKELEKIIQHYN